MMQFGRGLNAASYAALKKKKPAKWELESTGLDFNKERKKNPGGVPPRSAAVAGADDGVSGV